MAVSQEASTSNSLCLEEKTTGLDKLLNKRENSSAVVLNNLPTFQDVYPQIIASVIISLIFLQNGFVQCFSAILIPQIMDEKNELPVNKQDASWIASLPALSAPIGSFGNGIIMDKFGRKKGAMVGILFIICSWLLTSCASSVSIVPTLCAARIIAGIGMGMCPVSTVYISEISHEKYRPLLLMLNSTFSSMGILIVSLMSLFLDWHSMAACFCTIFSILLCFIVFFIPESPYWLYILSKREKEKETAEKSIRRLNNNNELCENQLRKLFETKSRLNDSNKGEDSAANINFCCRIQRRLNDFNSRTVIFPVLIITALLLLQQLCGVFCTVFHAVLIFKKLGAVTVGLNSYQILFFTGLLRFVISLFACVLTRTVARRKLIIASAFGMSLTSIAVTIYQYFCSNPSLISNNTVKSVSTIGLSEHTKMLNVNETDLITHTSINNSMHQWIPVVCIGLFICLSAIGLLSIPGSLIGELLPTTVKGTCSGLLITYLYLIVFVLVKVYPFLLDIFGVGIMFLIHGIMCFITILFTYLFLPETLGKSLGEIQMYFKK
ncbi:facilitated trehalose transporter Tret1-like [Lycorma delicatula]|uniref:facilitated trehalose transporter Tret1-like n=1 Tax=Lycorma delicatula TaxID=130591 RepID=UPI003F517CD3